MQTKTENGLRFKKPDGFKGWIFNGFIDNHPLKAKFEQSNKGYHDL